MSGRRYETLESAEQFRAFTEQSWKSLRLAESIATKHKVGLAVENHKDWRTDEMIGWLRRLASEYVAVCLDTGNSIALLEEPQATIEALAPLDIHHASQGHGRHGVRRRLPSRGSPAR